MSIEKIKLAAEQIMNRMPAVKGKGEEATKQAMVMPMLQAMGYDIWNPDEVHPEYEADFAVKKSGQKEKVDIVAFARAYCFVKRHSLQNGFVFAVASFQSKIPFTGLQAHRYPCGIVKTG